MNLNVIAAGLAVSTVLLAGAYTLGRHHGAESVRDKHTAELLKATQEAARVTHRLQEKADADRIKSDKERSAIRARLNSALRELRDRPSRNPPPASTDAPGGTGAGLSREDAGFLEGEAARANELREALAQCYRYADAVK